MHHPIRIIQRQLDQRMDSTFGTNRMVCIWLPREYLTSDFFIHLLLTMLTRTFLKVTKSGLFVRSFASEEFKLPPLPYSKKDLEPVISEKTLTCHYNGHHQTFFLTFFLICSYVNNLNAFTKGTDRKPLEYYITDVSGPIHNQAAQVVLSSHSYC